MVTTIAGLVLLLVAGGWIVWGRGAWNRYQIRELLRGAQTAHDEGRETEARDLLRRVGELANLSDLPPGPGKDLYKAFLIREAYEEQLKRDRQEVFIGRVPREIVALRDLRNEGRRLRLPCPAVVELMGAYADSRTLR